MKKYGQSFISTSHLLHTSLWSDLMKQAQAVPSPVLHYNATHCLFSMVLKKLFHTTGEDKVPSSSECMSQD